MIRFVDSAYAAFITVALSDSFSVVVYCLLAGFVILVAHKFFAARVEHFQLEMDRLSLAFIEGVTKTSAPLLIASHHQQLKSVASLRDLYIIDKGSRFQASYAG